MEKNKKRYIAKIMVVVAFIFLSFSDGWSTLSTSYYVDSTGGNDSSNGTSTSTPWKTISKVNGSSFNPGDEILFKRGEIWREELYIPNSGSSGNHILISAYGTGGNPVIMGSDAVTEWTDGGSNIWSASSSDPQYAVWFIKADGTVRWGNEESSQGAVNTEYDWYWLGNTLYVYSTSDPSSAYSSIEVAARNGIGGSVSYITIDGLEVAYSYFSGISAGGSNWTIQNSYAHHVGWITAIGQLSEQGDPIIVRYSNSTVSNTTAGEGGRHAISVYPINGSNVSNITIEGNVIYNSYHNHLDIQSHITSGNLSNVTIAGNIVYTTNDAIGHGQNGIFAQGQDVSQLNGLDIYNNVIFLPDSFAISIDTGGGGGAGQTNDIEIYNNTMYESDGGSYSGGIIIDRNVRNVKIKNNIGMNGTQYILYIQNTASISSANDVDYNNWYFEAGEGAYIQVGGRLYTTWSAYTSDTGYDGNGNGSDPKFINPTTSLSTADFRLQGSSPAINAGTYVGIDSDILGNPISSDSVDIGAYNSQRPVAPTNLLIK